MHITLRVWQIAGWIALLSGAVSACGGEISVSPVDAGGPADAGPAKGDAPWAVIVWQPVEVEDAQPEAAPKATAVLPCLERPVAPGCTASDPRFSGLDLTSAWQGCGGTSASGAPCGVLSVNFDEDGCALIDLSEQPSDSGAIECMRTQWSLFRFACSAGSALLLNDACN